MRMVLRIDPVKLRLVLQKSRRYQIYSMGVAERIKVTAIGVFNAQQRHDNEWRTSVTTPPKYVSSFRLEWHRTTITSRVLNDDPGWNWVEYGTHAGGKTFIMKYRPLGRALDIVGRGRR